MTTRRQTIAHGIYRDAYGYELRWRDRGLTRSKRFPLDTPLDTLKTYRLTKQRVAVSKRQIVGSFVRDAIRFLSRRKGRPGFKSDRAHLRPWIHRFTQLSRFTITRDAIQVTLDLWRGQGYSPRELRHRWRILSQFFATLDPDEPNPCKGVKLPAPIARRPKSVSNTILTDVALQLRKQELIGRLRTAQTRARFLVLATTGVRPIQLQRATPADVDLETRIWIVEPAKGDKGSVIYLNDEMRAAWRLFIQANAWGVYDARSFSKTLQRNGWPKGIRPYNTRHGVGQALKRSGADLGDIQDHLGHRSPSTTAKFYLEPDVARLKATSARLSGRIAIDAFCHNPTATTGQKQKAKAGQNTPHLGGARLVDDGRFQEPKRKKMA